MAQFPSEALAKQGKLVEMVDCLNLFEDYQHQNHSKLKGVISDKSEAQDQKDCYEKMVNNSLKEGKVREALTAYYIRHSADLHISLCIFTFLKRLIRRIFVLELNINKIYQ